MAKDAKETYCSLQDRCSLTNATLQTLLYGTHRLAPYNMYVCMYV